jgi:EAL domain-containing protein (putative c-di-GMP-specific phosphodiesterase class I)
VTIAEGVEEAEQLATAADLGFDLAQGYLLGRPLPSDEAERIIAAEASVLVSGELQR